MRRLQYWSILLLTGIAVGLIFGARTAYGAICTERSEAVKQLDSRYSEAPVAIGLAANGSVVEVFSTSNGSTWTMIITMPDGTSCMMAAGEAWENLPKMLRGEGT